MRYLLATLSLVLSCLASRAAEEVCMIRAASHSEALSGHPGQLTSDVNLADHRWKLQSRSGGDHFRPTGNDYGGRWIL